MSPLIPYLLLGLGMTVIALSFRNFFFSMISAFIWLRIGFVYTQEATRDYAIAFPLWGLAIYLLISTAFFWKEGKRE